MGSETKKMPDYGCAISFVEFAKQPNQKESNPFLMTVEKANQAP